MLTDEEIVDHVQHMGYKEMDVKLIESDDDGVDMGPSKMTLVECRESLKGIANVIAQDACLGDEDNSVTSPTIGKQVIGNARNMCYEPKARGNQEVFPVVSIEVDVKHSRSTSRALVA